MYTHTIDFQLQSKTSKDYAVFVMTEKVKSTPTRSELEDKYNVITTVYVCTCSTSELVV